MQNLIDRDSVKYFESFAGGKFELKSEKTSGYKSPPQKN